MSTDERDGRVHTVPRPSGPGWWNVLDGKIHSRHRSKSQAVAAGQELARTLRVEHTIDDVQDSATAEQSAASADGLKG